MGSNYSAGNVDLLPVKGPPVGTGRASGSMDANRNVLYNSSVADVETLEDMYEVFSLVRS